MPNIVQRSVPFYGNDLMVIRHGGEDYTPVKPICDILGIDWSGQRQRIERDEVLSEGMVVLPIPSAGGPQQTTCLLLKMLNGWLFGVSSGHIRPENREALRRYKLECYDALARAFGNLAAPAHSPDDTHHRLNLLDARVTALEAAVRPRRPYNRRPLVATPRQLPAPRLPLRERLTEDHVLILAVLAAGGAHGMSTMRLLASCGVTREQPGSFFRRLRELRAEGLVGRERRPVRITAEGRAALALHRIR